MEGAEQSWIIFEKMDKDPTFNIVSSSINNKKNLKVLLWEKKLTSYAHNVLNM